MPKFYRSISNSPCFATSNTILQIRKIESNTLEIIGANLIISNDQLHNFKSKPKNYYQKNKAFQFKLQQFNKDRILNGCLRTLSTNKMNPKKQGKIYLSLQKQQRSKCQIVVLNNLNEGQIQKDLKTKLNSKLKQNFPSTNIRVSFINRNNVGKQRKKLNLIRNI